MAKQRKITTEGAIHLTTLCSTIGKALLITTALLSVSACDQSSSSPTILASPPVAVTPPIVSAEKVVGAASIASCEQAGSDDASDCYVIEGTVAKMYGVIGDGSLSDYNKMRTEYPEVTEVVLVNVPGSANDDENIRVGEALHADKINTSLLANSEIASGGVDYFLAGITRRIENGARVGVHSWSDGTVSDASTLPRDHPSHQLYLDYYSDIQYDSGKEFYFFTINAAPSNSIHWMTNSELEQYKMATQASSQSVTFKNGGVAYIKSDARYLGRHIVSIEPDSVANVIGDASNTDFHINVQGVHFLDGGAGQDRLFVNGTAEDFLREDFSNSRTVLFDTRSGQNLTLHLDNFELIEFRRN